MKEDFEKSKRSLGIKNKRKGSDAERFYVNVFKELGYKHCVTSRLGSKLHDNAGVDIINIPFNIQIKAGKQAKLSPGKVLLNMESQIKSLFPEDDKIHTYPLLVIHRLHAFKKNYIEDVVYMSFDQFNDFTKSYGKIDYLFMKKRNHKTTSKFGHIVAVDFNELVKKGVFEC